MTQDCREHEKRVDVEPVTHEYVASNVETVTVSHTDTKEMTSTETCGLAEESDEGGFHSLSDNEDSCKEDQDRKDYLATTLSTQGTPYESYKEDTKPPAESESYNDHGRALPLKQFIIVYTGYVSHLHAMSL